MMNPYWRVKTTSQPLGVKFNNVDDARTLAKTMSDQNPVIDHVRSIGGVIVITQAEIEPT
jgi:hypothetical protein